MEIKELDPNKRYAIILNDHVTRQEMEDLGRVLKDRGINAVLLAGASIQGGERYFGLYCEQCGIWWVEPDGARLVFYPAPEIANAHLRDNGWFKLGPIHLWTVQEFGKEERADITRHTTEVCPVNRFQLEQAEPPTCPPDTLRCNPSGPVIPKSPPRHASLLALTAKEPANQGEI